MIPAGLGEDCLYIGIGLSSVIAIVAGVRLHRPVRSMPWYLMASAELLWVIGDAVDSWLQDFENVSTYPSLADAFYLAAYPILALGLLLLIRGRRPRRDLAGLLDSATLTAGLGLLSWVLLARPTLDIRAIGHDELVLHYQPIVDLATETIEGYEALVRWQHPDGRLLTPADFIATAEASDLICDLDAWVLDHACRQLAQWITGVDSPRLTMAVNISGRHISNPRIVDDVIAALNSSGIAARSLVLEITETVLIDGVLAIDHLNRLRALGVSISIDDFGTGYNSIARLRQLPIDILKIDKLFLDMTDDSTNKILRLMVQAAHAFGLPVVVEGVELRQQWDMLKAMGCESAQGFYIGRPVPAEHAGVHHQFELGAF